MCTIEDKYVAAETATGFKIAIKGNDENYYSPFTGMKYNIGKVMPMDKINYENSISFPQNILSPNNQFYNEKMRGMTGIIVTDIESIKQEFDSFCEDDKQLQFAVLKMTITGDLHNAIYISSSFYNTIIGNTILSIEDITNKIK